MRATVSAGVRGYVSWQRNTGSLRLLSSAIALVDAEPELAELGPDGLAVAWRIFRSGWNTSRNGPVLFDEIAAELVMADYREHSARIQVDMDHVSLNKESKAYDPRGLGYHDLELRDDGSLWACRAVWTKRGAECLESDPDAGRAAELPYYSPAFDTDTDLQFGDEPDRVTYIFNGGLVGTPATDRPMALAKAASRRKGQSMDPEKVLKAFRAMSKADRERALQIWKLTPSQAELPSAKLAALLKWQDSPDDVDPKVLASMVKAMGGDATAGIGGLMRQLRQFVEMAMKALMGEEPVPEAVPVESELGAMADNPEPKPDEGMLAAARKRDEELRTLRTEAAADRKLVDELRKERAAEQLTLRRKLVGQAVAMGRVTADLAWVDATADADERMPQGFCADMPIAELTTWATAPAGFNATNLLGAGPQPAGGWAGAATQPGLFQMSEYEAKRLEIAAKRTGRDLAWATRRYRELRTMQCRGAKASGRPGVLQIMAQRYTDDRNSPDLRTSNLVLTDVTGVLTPDGLEEYRKWASQAPVEQNAAVSIAAMREFDLVYNMTAATPGMNWAEILGDIRPSGSIADTTFPLDFEEVFYELKTDQATGHETPTLWSIDVRKKRYAAGCTAKIELLNEPGSFDYMMETWLRKAERMATARWDLQQLLAAVVLVDNPTLYERFLDGVQKSLTGKSFFATDHPINPFKPEVADINDNTTWSNYQTTATPFSREALTAELTQFDLTPNTRGRFMAMPASHVVVPTVLLRETINKISVQELLLQGALTADSGAGVGTMGTVSNEHTGSGLLPLEVQHLPGATLDADWLLFSEERKRAGMVPYAVCESAVEKVFVYGPDTDFALDTGFIKERRETDIRVVPIHPQAMRKIKGT
jgi:hypothetical protein